MIRNFTLNHNKKSILYKYIFILIIILIIPTIILGVSLYYYFNSSLEKETKTKYQSMVDMGTRSINLMFSDLRKGVVSFSQQEELTNSFYQTDLSPIIKLDLIRLLRKFSVYNDSIETSSLYYVNEPSLITDVGLYNFDSYFTTRSYNHKTPQEWKGLLENINGYKILNEFTVNHSTPDGKVDNMVKTVPLVYSLPIEQTPKARLILNIKSSYIEKIFNSSMQANGHFLGVINEDGSLFMDLDVIPLLPETCLNISKIIKSNKNLIKINKDNFFILYSPTNFNNGHVVWAIDAKELRAVSINIMITIACIVIILLFLGIPFIIYVSKHFYRPIKSILNISTRNGQSSGSFSELDFIKNHIQQLTSYSGLLKTELELKDPLVKEKLFWDLLTSKSSSTDSTNALSISSDCSLFYSLILKIEFKKEFNSSVALNIKENFEMKAATLLCSDIYEAEKSMYCCIVGTSMSVDDLYKSITIIINTFSYSDCRLLVAIGDPVEKAEYIYTSYHSAINLLNYKLLEDKNQVLATYNTNKKHSSNNIVNNNALANYLLANNKENSIQHMNDLFNEFYMNKQPLIKLNSFFSQYISVINYVLSEKKIESFVIYGTEEEFLERIRKCYDMEEVKQVCIEITEKIINLSNKNKRSNNTELINMITEYITQNYNNEIYLDLIAEKVGISSKYLSRFFKEQTGVNFVDYVNRFRVNKAKEYLKSATIKIADIPGLVGVTNMSTFDRIFKKYEGVSPTVYREVTSK